MTDAEYKKEEERLIREILFCERHKAGTKSAAQRKEFANLQRKPLADLLDLARRAGKSF